MLSIESCVKQLEMGDLINELLEKNKWLSKHLHNGIISGDQDKYYSENLTLKEELEIREHVADFHATSDGKRLPEMEKPINLLKNKITLNK